MEPQALSNLIARLRVYDQHDPHGMYGLCYEAAEELARQQGVLIKADKALKQWDDQNDQARYADKFVWEAWDAIRAGLK